MSAAVEMRGDTGGYGQVPRDDGPAARRKARPQPSRRRQPQQQQSPPAGACTESLMQLVEAQILSRLETPAGQQVLLEEAAFYGNDLDAARAAIVRCARNKVRRRLTSAVGERQQPAAASDPDVIIGPGGLQSGSGSAAATSSSRTRTHSNSSRSSSNSRGGFTSGEEDGGGGGGGGDGDGDDARRHSRQELERELAEEAEALGLRAEDIPFAAASLAKVNMRRCSRGPAATTASAAAAAAALAGAEGGGGDETQAGNGAVATVGGAAAAADSRSPRRVGSGRGPVFGKSLEAALYCNVVLPPAENRRVPDVVQMSLDYLNEHALSTEGLWRIPGDVGRVQQYKRAWDAGVGVDYAAAATRPHDVCSLLLLYFRELPGTVFGAGFKAQFVNDQALTSEDEIVDRLSGLVGMLPPANRDTLHAMLHHFMRLAANSQENMMTSENIATCVWASQGYYQSMKHMIDNYDLIFYMYG